MVRCLSYLNSMSDIVYKKYKFLVHTITFNIKGPPSTSLCLHFHLMAGL